jgi:bacteriorhodopsin
MTITVHTFTLQIWYLDYLVTCPLIILDFAITLDLPNKIIWLVTTATLLTISVASFLVAWPYRLYYYLVGVMCFGVFAFALLTSINRARKRIPVEALPWLDRACYVFFGMWPMFRKFPPSHQWVPKIRSIRAQQSCGHSISKIWN